MKICLEIPIRATPHQSVRTTRTGHRYQPKKIIDYKLELQKAVRDRLPDRFSVIASDTPIAVNKLHYQFEYPKSWSKKKKSETYYKISRPDLHDNLNKAFFDAMEGVLWERDQNICVMNDVRKFYGNKNKITIEIECLSY